MFEKSESTTERNNRRRNTIWYQTPFSKNVKRNIAEQFFYLLDKYFGKNHKYFKTFNINNVKVGYSCLALRKKCPCSELFWSAFFPHFLAFGLNMAVFSANAGKFGKNEDQNSSKYRHFLRRVDTMKTIISRQNLQLAIVNPHWGKNASPTNCLPSRS